MPGLRGSASCKSKDLMIAKIHKTPDGKMVLAVCDSDLLGKKFEAKNMQLDLSSDFFKGKEVSEEELLELMKKAYIININGKKCIKIALKAKVIEKDNIISVDGVKHAESIIVTE